jgi:hypothetical protein
VGGGARLPRGEWGGEVSSGSGGYGGRGGISGRPRDANGSLLGYGCGPYGFNSSSSVSSGSRRGIATYVSLSEQAEGLAGGAAGMARLQRFSCDIH